MPAFSWIRMPVRRPVSVCMAVMFSGAGAVSAIAAEPAAPIAKHTPPVVVGNPASPQPAAQTKPTGGTPKFECKETEYDFGTTWSMGSVEHTFVIKNTGNAPLTIDAKPTCGCTIAKSDKIIQPGAEGKVETILHTGNYNSQITKTIRTTTNDPAHKLVNLILKGTVKPRILSEPMLGAHFGLYTPEISLTKVFKLTNNTDEPMKIEVVQPDLPSVFKVTVKEIEPGKVAELTVVAQPPFKENLNSTQFQLKTGLKDAATMTLPCTITKPPILQIMPPSVRLPTVPLVAPYRQPIVVQNNGDTPIKLISAECNDDRIKIEKVENLAGKSYTVTAIVPKDYVPDPAKSPAITITTDYKDRPVSTVPVITIVRQHLPTTPPVAAAESHIGRPAPALLVKTTEGRSVRIGSGANQVMVLNFWASWCSPSRTQLPRLDQLYQVYHRKGVEFLNINVEALQPLSEIVQKIKELDTKVPVGLDPSRSVAKAYGVTQFPMLILIGKNGNVEAVRRGLGRSPSELDASFEAVAEQLDVLLQGKTHSDFALKPSYVGLTCALEGPRPAPATPSGSAMLYVETLRQDAGAFAPESKGSSRVYFRNAGGQPLTVREVTSSDGLSVSPDYPKTVAPGATASLLCTFHTPKGGQPFTYQLGIATNDPARPITTLAIVGESKPLVEVQPESGIDFSNRAKTFSVPRIATLVYNGQGTVEYKNAKSSSPKFEADIRPTRAQSNIHVLTVKAIPPFEPGEYTANITIETNQPEQSTVQVPVKLVMPKRIEVSPAYVSLANSGTIQQASVTIVNSGSKSLNILGVETSKPGIQTQFYPDTDGLSYKLQVTVPPGLVAPGEGERITIKTDDKEFGQIVIPIKVSGVR